MEEVLIQKQEQELEKTGAEVTYYDPWVPQYRERGEIRTSIPELTAEALEQADVVLVTTAHTNVDYAFVQKHAKAIFDTKNAMKNITPRDNIEVL